MTGLVQPPLISYNLKERGRKYTGTNRNFNIRKIVDYINGPVFQEKIKNRSVVGYFGHGVRAKFGLDPRENGIINGVFNDFEPAILTTSVRGSYDGTIEHKTEFIDNESGNKASRMFASRVGGFSSAIGETQNTFHGFDYVYDPNFTSNRGYTLDSASDDEGEIASYLDKEEDLFNKALFEKQDARIKQLELALDNAQTDNEQYLSMLSANGQDTSLDIERLTPYVVSLDSTSDIDKNIAVFDSIDTLPLLLEPKKEQKRNDKYKQLINRLGINS